MAFSMVCNERAWWRLFSFSFHLSPVFEFLTQTPGEALFAVEEYPKQNQEGAVISWIHLKGG